MPMIARAWRFAVCIAGLVMPWPMRRLWYRMMCGWTLHRSARIGLSVILADDVILDDGASIGHFNLIMPIGILHLHSGASLGKFNRVLGAQRTPLYAGEAGRVSALIVEEQSAITRNHIIDCTNTVRMGRFSILAGYRSQVLTHSPDFRRAAQVSRAVSIGAYTFIGTGSILLSGSAIPDYSIVAAGAVVAGVHEETYALYAGNPAKPVKRLAEDLGYFTRSSGWLEA